MYVQTTPETINKLQQIDQHNAAIRQQMHDKAAATGKTVGEIMRDRNRMAKQQMLQSRAEMVQRVLGADATDAAIRSFLYGCNNTQDEVNAIIALVRA